MNLVGRLVEIMEDTKETYRGSVYRVEGYYGSNVKLIKCNGAGAPVMMINGYELLNSTAYRVDLPKPSQLYRTPFGKKCDSMVNKYKNLSKYYDNMSGNITFPLDIMMSFGNVTGEVYALLAEPHFEDDNGNECNWAMEIYRGYDSESNLDNVEMVCLRVVESYC